MAKTVKKSKASPPKKRPYRKKKYPSEKKFACTDCGNKYYYPSKLKEHMFVHTGEKPYKCEECDKAFNTAYSLKTHQYIHTNEKPFKCSFCKYECRDGSSLRKHQFTHMGVVNTYQCKICTKSYKNKWKLKQHVAEIHLQQDVRKLSCEHCEKRFKTRSLLTRHVKNIHFQERACECPVCNKRLTNRSNLPQHLMTHVEDRPYVCHVSGCQKSYKDSSSLRKHSLIHYPDEQHACPKCGQMFTRLERMKRHERAIHGFKQKVECDYCKVKFLSKNYLIKHIKQKHSKKRKKYICDMCRFKTYNKPSIVMHIKYGHGNEHDRECHICHTTYKKHIYLKAHYVKTHNFRYKTKKRPSPPRIKEEPLDLEDQQSVDLFEIEKEEPIDQEPNSTTEGTVNDEARALLDKYENINRMPEDVFDEYYVDHITKMSFDKEPKNRKRKYKIDIKSHVNAKRSIQKLIVEARRKQTEEAVERARQSYNERIKDLSRGKEKEKMEIHFFKKTKNADESSDRIKCHSNEKSQILIVDDDDDDDEIIQNDEGTSQNTADTSLNATDTPLNTADTSLNIADTPLNTADTSLNTADTLPNNEDTSPNNADKSLNDVDGSQNNIETSDEEFDDKNDSDEEWSNEKVKKTKKINFNTHQCYVCFKLYETKEKLIDHCKVHFDICNEKSWKKCPLCDYVSHHRLPVHLRKVHDIHIRMPSKIHDKKTNENGCRYYLKVDNPLIKQIEVIPSIKNLNKIASCKIDEKNRRDKNRKIMKTKLVKKGKEWIVEKEKIDISDAVIPQLDSDALKNVKVGDNDSYFDSMKKMYHVMKKSGQKILFPCQKCEKICQNLAALKLHYRKHDTNAKPFKPKVWKHKLKMLDKKSKKRVVKNDKIENDADDATENVTNTDNYNRVAKPKPIKNNHKCDYELQEFYKNNIRGGDIEFWQFLKIFNRLSKENIKDFKDLNGRHDFGIGHQSPDDGQNVTAYNNESVEKTVNKTSEVKSQHSKEVTKNISSSKNVTKTITRKSETVTKKNRVTKKVTEKRTKMIKNPTEEAKKIFVKTKKNNKCNRKPETSISKQSLTKIGHKRVNTKTTGTNNKAYIRVIMISKYEYKRRKLAKEKLRDKLAQR